MQQIAADMDGGGFASVVGVFFKGKSKDADALAVDRIIKSADDFLHESALLPIVKMHDLTPVFCDMGKVKGIAEIYQVEDVFLETRAAKADGCFEEFRADPRVHADRASDLIHISPSGFAEGGD